MKAPLNRRGALARIALLAMLPTLVSGHPAQARGEAAFRPPSGPMIFTRRLRRELGDGAAIEVTRTFEISFLPVPGGYRVEGAQTSAHVSAPPSLGAFARLEEQRQETGMFPLQLDSAGQIVGGPGGGAPADMSATVNEAFAWLGQHPLTASTRAAAQEFVIGLQTVASRITTAVPPDLFTGTAAPLQRTQDLTMPDGQTGKVSVSYNGTPTPGGGLLERAERIVTTDAGGSRLRSIEQWTLAPKPAVLSR